MTEQSPYLPEDDSPPEAPTPWGFRITLAMVAVYLGYRIWQGLVWVWGYLFG